MNWSFLFWALSILSYHYHIQLRTDSYILSSFLWNSEIEYCLELTVTPYWLECQISPYSCLQSNQLGYLLIKNLQCHCSMKWIILHSRVANPSYNNTNNRPRVTTRMLLLATRLYLRLGITLSVCQASRKVTPTLSKVFYRMETAYLCVTSVTTCCNALLVYLCSWRWPMQC